MSCQAKADVRSVSENRRHMRKNLRIRYKLAPSAVKWVNWEVGGETPVPLKLPSVAYTKTYEEKSQSGEHSVEHTTLKS